jgi:predicted phosphoribosyltransferase
LQSIAKNVDKVVCLHASQHFSSVGQWYQDFSQVSDSQVISGLSAYWQNNNA